MKKILSYILPVLVTVFLVAFGVSAQISNPNFWLLNGTVLSPIDESWTVDSSYLGDIDHDNLLNIGTNSHAQIDTHLGSTSNPHSVTAAQAGAVSLEGDEVIDGEKTFNKFPILPSESPDEDYQPSTKKYVDDLVSLSISWKAPVLDVTDEAPISPEEGDRYVTIAKGGEMVIGGDQGTKKFYLEGDVTSDFPTSSVTLNAMSTANNGWYTIVGSVYNGGSDRTEIEVSEAIPSSTFDGALGKPLEGDWATVGPERLVEYDGADWNFDGQTPGWAVLNFNDNKGYVFGEDYIWTEFAAQQNYIAGDQSIDISGLEISVNYDDSSLGLVSNKLAVKSMGITNDMLFGGIADSKLAPIISANKVNGSSLFSLSSISVGAGLIPLANIPTITVAYGGVGHTSYTVGDLLFADTTSSLAKLGIGDEGQVLTVVEGEPDWADATGGGGGAADFIYEDITLHSHGGSNFTYSNLPVNITAASSYLRKKMDLTGADKYRLCVTQALAGYDGSKLRLRYSLNNSTFLDIDADNSGDLPVGLGTGVKCGSWTDLVAGAKQDVWLQIYGYGGDGIVDPTFRQMSVQIKYNSSIVEGGDSDDLYTEVSVHSAPNTSATWTNMPAAETEFLGNNRGRQKFVLTNASQYRLVVQQAVAGYAGADLNLQYSLNGSTFLPADTGGAGEIDVGTGTVIKYGAWTDLVPEAKGDVWLRLVGKDGDGIVDPQFRQVKIQFKEAISGGGGATPAGDTGDIQINDEGALGVVADNGFFYDSGKGQIEITPALKTNDYFEFEKAYPGYYGVSNSPLNQGGNDYNDFPGDEDISGSLFLNSLVIDEGPDITQIYGESKGVDSIDGTQDVGVGLISFDLDGYVYITVYFPDDLFADQTAWETFWSGLVPPGTTYDYFTKGFYTNNGAGEDYDLANPDTKNFAVGYATPKVDAEYSETLLMTDESEGNSYMYAGVPLFVEGFTVGGMEGYTFPTIAGDEDDVLVLNGDGDLEWGSSSSLWVEKTGNDIGRESGSVYVDSLRGNVEMTDFIIQPGDGTAEFPNNANMIFRSGLYYGGGSHGFFGWEFGTGGNYWLKATTENITFNDAGQTVNFIVNGNSIDNLLYVSGSDNFIGIGTSNPQYPLDIQRANSMINLTSQNQDGQMESGILMRYGSNNWYGGFLAMAAQNTLWGENGEIIMGARLHGDYGDPTDHLVAIMDKNLNFGIGTDDPTGKFQVGPYLSSINEGGGAQGWNEITYNGLYTGSEVKEFRVEIDALDPDTFQWSNDGGSTWEATGVTITGEYQTLEDNVKIKFYTDGADFEVGNYWDFVGYPVAISIIGDSVGIGTTDLDGTPDYGRLTVQGTTNNGSTYVFVGRDSDNNNIASLDTDGNLYLDGNVYANANAYGEIYTYDKSVAFNIVTTNKYHAFKAVAGGDIVNNGLNGWTWDAGRVVDADITSEADNGSGLLRIVTSGAHSLSNDDIVVLVNMNDLAHDDACLVAVIDGTTFDCSNISYSSGAGTSSGRVDEPAYLEAGANASGDYFALLNIDGTAANLNKDWKWELNKGITPYNNIVTERNTTNTLAQMTTGGLITGIVPGDRIWLSGKNITDTTDYTVKNFSLSVHKL